MGTPAANDLWLLILGGATFLNTIITVVASAYAISVSRRSTKSGTAVDLGREIVQMVEFREKVMTLFRDAFDEIRKSFLDQARTESRTQMIDQLQVMLGREQFIAAPQYKSDIDNVNRRLDGVENRLGLMETEMNDIPRRTAEQVMLHIKARTPEGKNHGN